MRHARGVTAMERHPAGVFEASFPGAEMFDYRLRITYPGGHVGRDRRPVSLRPRHHRIRRVPVRAGQAHADLRQARRAPDAHRRRRRRALRSLGAQRRARQRRRRLQRVGRPRPSDAAARPDRRVGDLHPGRRRTGSATSSRFARTCIGELLLKTDPVRVPLRAAAAVGLDRGAARLRMAGRAVVHRSRGQPRLVQPADRDLRSAPRLVGARARKSTIAG